MAKLQTWKTQDGELVDVLETESYADFPDTVKFMEVGQVVLNYPDGRVEVRDNVPPDWTLEAEEIRTPEPLPEPGEQVSRPSGIDDQSILGVATTVAPPIQEGELGMVQNPNEPAALTPEYESWTVSQLKDELAERGLSKAGNKTELIERLRA